MWRPVGEMCAAATIMHAVDALRGRMMALCYMWAMKKTWPAGSTLAGMTGFEQQMRMQVPVQPYAQTELRRLTKAGMELFDEGPYDWLSWQRGCRVV